MTLKTRDNQDEQNRLRKKIRALQAKQQTDDTKKKIHLLSQELSRIEK